MTLFTADTKSGELKAISLPGLSLRGSDYSLISVDLAYRYVPWFRRACKGRANDAGRFPLALEIDGEDVSEGDEWQAVMNWTRRLIYQQALNVTKYGAAYHLIESNPAGTRFEPRHLPTQSVIIESNMLTGLTGFRVNGIGPIPLKKMLWLWEQNDLSEVEPGSSDGEAALKAAGLLYAIEEMVNRYMKSGGVPITAVMVPTSTSREDRDILRTWFERMAAGFQNAFKFLAVNKDTTFQQIGNSLKDTVSVELTDQQRDNVAVALGVPPSMLAGKSSDESNSRSEKMQYYSGTVIPFVEMLEPLLNERLYARMGVRLRFRPEMLDVMQESQVAQAQAIASLTGGKQVLSVRTAIEWMGLNADDELDRLEDEKEAAPPPPAAPPPDRARTGYGAPCAARAPRPRRGECRSASPHTSATA